MDELHILDLLHLLANSVLPPLPICPARRPRIVLDPLLEEAIEQTNLVKLSGFE
jgi:hypothetical protein